MATKNIKELANHQVMETFTLKNIPSLDTCVLGALELFTVEKLPKINIKYKRPIVVGSGNAEATGRILFHDKDAIFSNESDAEYTLKHIKNIDGMVLISASGSKHAPILAKLAKKYKKKVTLITNNEHAQAKPFVNDIIVLPKQREPYTYNTSTYMGMILAKTGEDPKKTYDFITKKIDNIKLPNFSKCDRYFLILPNKFGVGIKRMLEVKFIELFGRMVARDVETKEYMKHAVTVVPGNEIFISFGDKNPEWGKKKNQLFIPLPKDASYGAAMAICYYIIGKIQKKHPHWFNKNIERYTDYISKIFKSNVNPIVE